jgi:hypothetical protein
VVLYRGKIVKNIHDGTRAASVAGDHLWATRASFGDYNGDGWEDLFVSHYVDFHPDKTAASRSGSNCRYLELMCSADRVA